MPNFSLRSSLSDLTQKGQLDHVHWSEEAQQAFQALTNSPVLRNPDFDQPFVIHTGASETRCCALSGEKFVVLYGSRKPTLAERRYNTVKREALAIKQKIEELSYYLMAQHFTLVTDTNAWVPQWFLLLKDFSFQIQH